uniref:T-complex protein 11-like protein 1 n=1 Tax=Glossina brevipalpis TaxID=37001 RepID=A0A1A9WAM9_9MUSC
MDIRMNTNDYQSEMNDDTDANATNETNDTDTLMSTSSEASSLHCPMDGEIFDKMPRFILPSMDGSPPKVLSFNELSNVFKNIRNMELAHEIALNTEFKLEPYEPPENTLEKRIKDNLHKAFWDSLRNELNETPPRCDCAIRLLGDIKECFAQILSPTNKRALEHINEVLDETVIRQQAEKDVLNFRSYADFVIQIMAKSCAPARDEIVQNLLKITNVVDMFRGILETMALLKLDMANFLLDFSRNEIMANVVEYEKRKFNEYRKYYKFGFPATENWLNRNRPRDVNNVTGSNAYQAVSNAYMELMNWPDNIAFPEVLSIDKERILKLNLRAKRLCICAALISISSGIPIISQRPNNRTELSKQIEILIQNMNDEKNANTVMENIWEQIKVNINQYLQKEHQPVMDDAFENMLKTQIMQIVNKDAAVRQLMWKRLQTYFRLILRLKTGTPPPPPGFVDFKVELENYALALKRVIVYNHAVFSDYISQVLNKHQIENTEPVDKNQIEIVMHGGGDSKQKLLDNETAQAHQ